MIPPKTGNKYIVTNIDLQNTENNRYSIYDIYDNNNDLFLETYELKVAQLNDNDIYHTITSDELYRWDLIAYNYYNNWLLAWVIMEANGIIDPFDMEVGQVIRIPEYSSLFGQDSMLEDYK